VTQLSYISHAERWLQAVAHGGFARTLKETLLEVNAYSQTGRPNFSRHGECNISCSAADIQAPHPRRQSDLLK
jgi:hypothetical protein